MSSNNAATEILIMPQEWFVRRGDKVRGPLTSDDVKQLVAKGIVVASDMVRKSENPEWRQAGTVKGLFGAVGSEAPVPSPQPQSKAEAPFVPVPPPLPSSPANRQAVRTPHPSTAKAVETMQAGLTDIMSTAKQAKDLAAAHARRTQITQMTLPKAYLALGKDVFVGERFREEFSDLFQRINTANDEIAKVAATTKERPQATDLKGKLQSGAAQLMAQGQTTKLGYQRESLVRELGKKAFESHGTAAGSPELVSPITSAKEEIARLDEQIAGLSSGKQGSIWQRLPIAALLTVFCWPVGMLLVWFNPRLTRRSKWIWTGVSAGAFLVLAIIAPKSKNDVSELANTGNSSSPNFASVNYSYDFSKDDFKSIPTGAVRKTRDKQIDADTEGAAQELLGKLITEEGYIDANGRFIEHGPFTIWENKEKTIKYSTGSMFQGKLHGLVTFHVSDVLYLNERPFVHGQQHGIERVWYKNKQPARTTGFIKGEKHGKSVEWQENGSKKDESDWVEGKREGKQFVWWENGKVNFEANFHLDLLHGPYSVWNQDGFNTHLGSFDNGRKSGRWQLSFPACSEGRKCSHCKGTPYSIFVNSEKWSGGSSEEFFTLLHLHSNFGLGVDENFSPRHGRPRINWTVSPATFERVFDPPDIGPSPMETLRGEFPNWDWLTYSYSCSDGDVSLRSHNAIKTDGKGTRIILFVD